jgi:glycosyltransferase involved in cell wall biosynthesis
VKILHIISSGGMYGAEAVILNMSRTLNEGSHTSVLGVFANSSNPNLQLHEVAAKEGVESHLIPCKGQIDPAVIASIRELAAQTNAEIVHAHGYKADIYVYLALRTSRIPFVSTCHNWIDSELMVSLYGMADRLVLRNYPAVIAVSDEVRQRLLKAGVSAHKIHLVRNGIDLRPFDRARPSLSGGPTSDYSPTVGFIGRLSSEKGADIFLNAAAMILVEVPSTKFVVIGEGPDRDKLESLIDELKLRQSVSMLGRRDDMPSVYASLNIMVSSSRQEGLPMAILEGMASRLPLVATRVGDVPTVVLDGQTGVVVPPENVALLASAVVALLRNPAQRERLGAAARKLIEDEFSADRMTADYLRVYNEAVSRGTTK